MRATVTSHQVNAIPAALLGKIARFQADTTAVFLLFGADNTVEADLVQPSAGSAPVLTAHPKSSVKIEAGQYQDFRIPTTGISHFSHVSADTNGFLRISDATGVG